ncbi:MAG: UDP-2,3-diacylglucosamine diphosphatase LpxI [Alphaproteobacteria bacterium]|nr:UDP-2,3-diacylglucosamine diphosphatase LpxI [Alphaproteobacteria bacterium]
MQATATAPTSLPKLGIIAGMGELPRAIIEACETTGREFYVLAIEEAAEEETVIRSHGQYTWIRLGAIGKALDLLRKQGVEELVMAGRVNRPKLSAIRPDLKATKLLAKLGSNLFTGDNKVLSSIVEFLEEEGFKIIGAEQIVQDIITPEGLIGSIYPDKRSQVDIEIGARIATSIGKLDVGQAVVIQNQQVLGVEAVEGTDALIKRCALLKNEEKGGVLVKVKKPQQEGRVDLPTIGIPTVENVAEAGFNGIALQAGASLILNRREVARRADQLGIFIIGFSILE